MARRRAKVPQYRFLSAEANELRRRDRIPPWGIHPCEVDSFGRPAEDDASDIAQRWRQASALRDAIENGTATPSIA